MMSAPVKRPRLTEDYFSPVIMPPLLDSEGAGAMIEMPAGKGPRRLLDVSLGIVAFSKREQLEQFTGDIFVRAFLLIGLRIEIEQRGRILRDSMQKRSQRSERMDPE